MFGKHVKLEVALYNLEPRLVCYVADSLIAVKVVDNISTVGPVHIT